MRRYEAMRATGYAIMASLVMGTATPAPAAEPSPAGPLPSVIGPGVPGTLRREDTQRAEAQEQARLDQLDKQIRDADQALAPLTNEVKALAEKGAATEASAEFKEAAAQRQRVAAGLDAALAAAEPADKLRPLFEAEVAAAEAWASRRQAVFGPLDEKLTLAGRMALERAEAQAQRDRMAADREWRTAMEAIQAKGEAHFAELEANLIESHRKAQAEVTRAFAGNREAAQGRMRVAEEERARRLETARKASGEAAAAAIVADADEIAAKAHGDAERDNRAADRAAREASEASVRAAHERYLAARNAWFTQMETQTAPLRDALLARYQKASASARGAREGVDAERAKLMGAELDRRAAEAARAATVASLRPAEQVLAARTLADVRLDRVGLAQAIEYFATASGANIIVDWHRLEAAGVARNALVTYAASGVNALDALRAALADVAGKGGGKPLRLSGGTCVMWISTEDGVRAWEAAVARLREAGRAEPWKKLRRPLPEVRLVGTDAETVIEFYKDVTQLGIDIDWEALGVGKHAAVGLAFRQVPFDEALLLTLVAAGAGEDVPVAFDGKVVRVGKK